MKKIVFISFLSVFLYPQNDTSKIAKAAVGWNPTQRACYDNCKVEGKCVHMTGRELQSCRSNCALKCD